MKRRQKPVEEGTMEEKIIKRIKNLALFIILALVLNKFISLGPRAKKIDEYKKSVTNQIETESEKKTKKLDSSVELDSEGRKIVKNPNDYLVLINKDRYLPADYEPEDLVVPNVEFVFREDLPKRYMRKEAGLALEKLFQAGLKDGLELYASSGYRPYATQKWIFDDITEKEGLDQAKKLVALPGQSEHQTGLAMDLTSREIKFKLLESFEETKEGKWIRDNAHKFGFIIRYPKDKEDLTGYAYEPWHIRYVGLEPADEIYKNNLSLEEYLEQI